MSASTYPARHTVLREVLRERGFRLECVIENKTEAWISAPQSLVECVSRLAIGLPTQPVDNYDDACESIEIALGLQLPRRLRLRVEAERARCLAAVSKVRQDSEAIASLVTVDAEALLCANVAITTCDEIARRIAEDGAQ